MRGAALPIATAVGGMAAPALIYAALNVRGAGAAGWAIPTASDIAFVVGVLALVGRSVPMSVKVFVLAVAIVDDVGAVLVIAVFYTGKISWPALGMTGGFLAALMLECLARPPPAAVHAAERRPLGRDPLQRRSGDGRRRATGVHDPRVPADRGAPVPGVRAADAFAIRARRDRGTGQDY